MRETKVQKIERLGKRVKEKEMTIKELEKKVKSLEKELNNYKKNLEIEIHNNYISQTDSLQDEIDSLEDKIQITSESYHNISSLCRTMEQQIKVYGKLVKFSDFKKEEERQKLTHTFYIDTLWFNRKNLEGFEGGCYDNTVGVPFFNYKNLIININPYNGGYLNEVQRYDILERIKYNPLYIEYMDKIKEYDESFLRDWDGMELVYTLGKDLYEKLYKDYDFSRFSIQNEDQCGLRS